MTSREKPQHYVMRLVRGGPLVPARMQWLDHEFGEPGNKRDRWPALLLVVDIAGEIVVPEELTDRFHWPAGHWKYAQRISEAEYRHRFELMRWAERNRPDDPRVKPRRKIDRHQMPLPNFDRENAL